MNIVEPSEETTEYGLLVGRLTVGRTKAIPILVANVRYHQDYYLGGRLQINLRDKRRPKVMNGISSGKKIIQCVEERTITHWNKMYGSELYSADELLKRHNDLFVAENEEMA